MEEITVTDTRFYLSMGFLKDIHIANVLYAYETLDGTNIVLDHNNAIYIWDIMKYSLANPLQSE